MPAGGTPAIQKLRQAGVPYTLHAYQHDPQAPSYGLEAAASLAVPAERVFKTLVTRLDGTTLAVAVVPVAARLNLKALAAAAAVRRAELATPADAERATGYVVGGISPLGQRRALPTFVDSSALGHETIFVSAGRRGLDIELAPGDLLGLTGGRAATLTE